MIPYYDEDGITIYNARCEDVLPDITGVDLVLTSPPYNLRGDGNENSIRGGQFSKLVAGYADHGDDLPHAVYVAWQQKVLRGCWSTLTDTGAIFYVHKPIVRGNSIRTPLELIPDGIPLRQIVIWDRCNGFNRRNTYYVPSHEWVMLLTKPEFRTSTMSVFDVWRVPPEQGTEHPAPFPLRLARIAVESTPARVVLDPFMGSGTTLRAAKDCGRRAIGIEVSERYCEIAATRLAQGVLDFGDAA